MGLLLFGPSAQSQSEVDSALRLFLGPDSNTFAFDLDTARPQPESPSHRDLALKHLPREGRVQHLNKAQRHKLKPIELILRLHQRETVYAIRVYEAPEAFVGAQFGTVLMISTTALSLLEAQEVQALVAHEVGHEYVWKEFQDAERRRNNRRRRELELFCDGVAILTLRRAGVNPVRLLTGVEKLTDFNVERAKTPPNPDDHPSLQERKKFVEALMKWVEHASPSPHNER